MDVSKRSDIFVEDCSAITSWVTLSGSSLEQHSCQTSELLNPFGQGARKLPLQNVPSVLSYRRWSWPPMQWSK